MISRKTRQHRQYPRTRPLGLQESRFELVHRGSRAASRLRLCQRPSEDGLESIDHRGDHLDPSAFHHIAVRSICLEAERDR